MAKILNYIKFVNNTAYNMRMLITKGCHTQAIWNYFFIVVNNIQSWRVKAKIVNIPSLNNPVIPFGGLPSSGESLHAPLANDSLRSRLRRPVKGPTSDH